MKKVIVYILFLVSIVVNAQEVKELDNKFYKIGLGKSPMQQIEILKRTSLTDDYKPTLLKKGDYKLNSKRGIVFTFFVNGAQLIENGEVRRDTKNEKFVGIIKKGRLQSVKAHENGKLVLSGKVNHKDSILSSVKYFKNGKIKKEETEFFTTKNHRKKITTTYNEEGGYIIENQISKTSKQFNAKGELIKTKKNHTTAKEVLKSKE